MNEEKIMEILLDWNYWGNYEKEFIERKDYEKKIENLSKGNEIIVVKGIRRAGKSSISYFFLKKLINSGLNPRKTLIINFEDPRLPPILTLDKVNKIFETYLKNVENRPEYVMLDEIQYVERWEKFARFLSEGKNLKVIVTGSSSKLMSEEYATVLSGRHVDVEVFPLSFREFLYFKGLKIEEKIEMMKKRIEIKKLLDEYLEWGGFPEIALTENKERKMELLKTYFNDILLKDVVKRYKIKKVIEIENLAKFYISNISNIQSFHKLKEILNISLDSVERFSKYLLTARLFLFLDNFSPSIKTQIRSKKKVYTIDLGFYKMHGFKLSENIGRIMENIVMLHLARKMEFQPLLKIFYLKSNDYEVDFVLNEGLEITQLIQATYASSKDEIERREIKGLLKASELLKCKNLLIITWDYEDELNVENKTIKCIPLWKWLLKA
ncbi:MAG: ATP-binding protein [Candidatus Aenigmatarchaeota archaeon]